MKGKDVVFIKSLGVFGTVEAVWQDKSMFYVTPIDTNYGNWFLADDLKYVSDEDYYSVLWDLAGDE